jgi:ceramide glucosyltransferase
VGPLALPRVGAATGYRWYLPETGGFWSAVLSSWNGSVATTLGDHDHNFAWGGATAILRGTFERIGVRARWAGAVSDDYALTRAVTDAGLSISFVPRCLMPTREDASLASLLEFTTRQVTITRVYRPKVWWIGFISHALFVTAFFGGIVTASAIAFSGRDMSLAVVMLGLIYLFGSIKGAIRMSSAADALPEVAGEVARLWWMFCLLWPLVSLVFLYNFIRSAATRRINWRGVVYEMKSPTETVIIESGGR